MTQPLIFKYCEKYSYEITKENNIYNVYQLRFNTPLQNENDEVVLEKRYFIKSFPTKKQAMSYCTINCKIRN